MKKYILLLPLVILGLSIAGIFILDDGTTNSLMPEVDKNKIQKLDRETVAFDAAIPNYFTLNAADATLFAKMKIYPIRASEQYLADHKALGEYLTLAEALADGKVRILEMGKSERERYPDAEFNPNPLSSNWNPTEMGIDFEVSQAMENGASVNTLTIENTSNDPIYIMAGDVVIGGNQDRVIAEDMIAMPHSGKIAVPVFCVEPNRWSPRPQPSDNAPSNEEVKEGVYAFTGYFNVAANSIRQTVVNEKNQGEVWAKVGDIRVRNEVKKGGSSTYGDLAKSPNFTKNRNVYLAKFETLFDAEADVIGFVAVSGDKVLGADIFGTPALFKKQYKALLHAYIVDALTYGGNVNLSDEQVQQYFQKSAEKYFTKQTEEAKELSLKFVKDNKIVHFTDI